MTLGAGETQFEVSAATKTFNFKSQRNNVVDASVWVSIASASACEMTVEETEADYTLVYVGGAIAVLGGVVACGVGAP